MNHEDPRSSSHGARNLPAHELGLAARLRDARLRAGLSRQDLADRSGVNERSIRDIENGRRPRVQEKTVALLAAGLGCAVDELIPMPEVAAPAAPSPAAGSSRPRRLLGWFAVASVLVVVMLFLAAFVAVTRGTHELVSGDLVMRDGLFGRVLWTLDEGADVVEVVPAPWPDNDLLALMDGGAGGNRVLRLDRADGHIEATYEPDLAAVRAAFTDTVLAAGHGFRATDLRFLDLDGDGEHELIAIFTHNKLYPTCLAVYTPDGRRLAQYTNRGHIADLHVEDLDGDGRDELLVAGTDNHPDLQGGCLLLLEQGHWNGAPIAGADGARHHVVLPSFGSPIMERLGGLRLTASSLKTLRTPGGDLRIQSNLMVKGVSVLVTCDEQLRPLTVEASDGLLALVAGWPPEWREKGGFPSQAWLREWLAGARVLAGGEGGGSGGPVSEDLR